MKKYIAMVSLLCFLMPFTASCASKHIQTDDIETTAQTGHMTNSVGTDVVPVPESTENASDVPKEDPEPDEAVPNVVLLTQPYLEGYELEEALDYDAFLDYLEVYFGELIGEDVLVCITDMIDSGGVVTLLTEYHDIAALEKGRRTCTVRGGGNLFIEYSTESGADFTEHLFAGSQRLHDFHAPEQFIDGDYVFIDSDGYVGIHEASGRTITTPAKYMGGCHGMEDVILFLCDSNEMSGKARQHYILAVYTKRTVTEGAESRVMMVYTTKDGGASWSEAELDHTPTTTQLIYPVTDISLRSLYTYELDTCSIVLGTSRCEVFYYVTNDGGVTWERRSNFKLLNYRNSALLGGGVIFDDLALMSFEARNGKNPNVYISRDGGYNWALMDIPTPDGLSDTGAYACALWKWNGAAMIDVMYGEEMHRYVSFDRGETWEWDGRIA